MNPESFFLGVDGGGTKTRAVILDGNGRFYGQGLAGPCNPVTTDIQTMQAHIVNAINNAYLTSGLSSTRFDGAFLGLAGVVTPQDRERVHNMIAELDLAERIDLHHDCRAALAGATGAKPGVVVISGTGSSAFGRNEKGDEQLVGGWGYLFRDEGSAYDIGRRAWAQVTRAQDRLHDPSPLSEALKSALGIGDLRQSIPRLFGGEGAVATRIASFAPLVLDLAKRGDAQARAIVSDACKDLAMLVGDITRNLAFTTEPVKVARIGSVLANPVFQLEFKKALAIQAPAATLTEPQFDPAVGAALLAAQSRNVCFDQAFWFNLKKSLDRRNDVRVGLE